MLLIKIPEKEYFDEKKEEFVYISAVTLKLEYSLAAISEWEGIYHKSFFSKQDKTIEEYFMFIKCMDTEDDDKPLLVYESIKPEDHKRIAEYIDDSRSARSLAKKPEKKYSFVTSEDFYFSMFYHGLPLECEKWHFNKLVSVLHLCNIRNSNGKKMSKKDTYAMYDELNRSRRKALGSKG